MRGAARHSARIDVERSPVRHVAGRDIHISCCAAHAGAPRAAPAIREPARPQPDSTADAPDLHERDELHELDDSEASGALRELHLSRGAMRALASLACGAKLGNDLEGLEREDLSSLLTVLGAHMGTHAEALQRFVDDFGVRRYRALNPQGVPRRA